MVTGRVQLLSLSPKYRTCLVTYQTRSVQWSTVSIVARPDMSGDTGPDAASVRSTALPKLCLLIHTGRVRCGDRMRPVAEYIAKYRTCPVTIPDASGHSVTCATNSFQLYLLHPCSNVPTTKCITLCTCVSIFSQTFSRVLATQLATPLDPSDDAKLDHSTGTR